MQTQEHDEDVDSKLDVSTLDQVLRSTQDIKKSTSTHVISTISGLTAQGFPTVEYQKKTWEAQSIVPIDVDHIGQDCLILFPENNRSPIVVGIIWNPQESPVKTKVIEASTAINLNCGKSSLTLEADGTVCLKGVTVTTQAYGANRVKGAAIKIN